MEAKKPAYTIFEKIPGVPQMLKLAPVHLEEEKQEPARSQYPLTGVANNYPLG